MGDVTIEGYDGPERILLSYDVSGSARSKAATVCQIVFGRVRSNGGPDARRQRGFIHRPGVVWVGQSVLVLPPQDARELSVRLQGLGIRVSVAPITISGHALEAFRRVKRGMA